MRIALLFGVVAVVPAILVAIIASITLDRGLDRWFSDRTRGMLTNAVNIAQAYVRDYSFATRADLENVAAELSRLKPIFEENRERFRRALTAQAAVRGIPAAMMVKGDHSLVERAEINIGREFVIPPALDLRRATADDPILALAETGDYLHAVTPVKGYEDTFLYMVRPVDPHGAHPDRAQCPRSGMDHGRENRHRHRRLHIDGRASRAVGNGSVRG